MTSYTIVARILIVTNTCCNRLRVDIRNAFGQAKESGNVDSLVNGNSAIGL